MNEALAQRLRRQEERHAERAKNKTTKIKSHTDNIHPMRGLRLRLGMSKRVFSKAIGYANYQAIISRVETGREKPSQEVIKSCVKLAKIHNIAFDVESIRDSEKPKRQGRPQQGLTSPIPSLKPQKSKAPNYKPSTLSVSLPDSEKIPTGDLAIEHHNTQLGELLAQLDDHSASLLGEAHLLVAALHQDCSTHEKTKFNQALARNLGALSHSVGQLKNLAFQIESDEPMQAVLDANLNAEAQAWKDLLAINPAVNKIRGHDPRVGELIFPILQLARVDDESTPNLTDVIRVVVERERDPLDPSALTRRLREARERIEELSGLWFEQERDEFLAMIPHRFNAERNAEIIARRYGWDGRPSGTLQEVADAYGVSRERIRQICGPFENAIDKLATRQLFAPVLDRVLASLGQSAPLIKAEAQTALDKFPDITEPLNISDFLQWANWLGRSEIFSLEEIAPRAIYLVHPAGNRQSAGEIHTALVTILKVAHKAVSRWGVAQLDDIVAKATEYSLLSEFPLNFDAADIEKIIKSRLDFHWLDEEQGWFWFSDSARDGLSTNRNALITQIRKVFAVTPRITIGELRGGVSRHHRREGFAPPRKVLIELCRQLPGIGVDDEEVFLDPPRDLSSKLSPSESLLWEILKKHGPVMARPHLEKLCAARSMNRVTFYSYLNSSPIIARFTSGVFGLRGALPTPGDIETALENLGIEYSRRRRRVLKDYGWTNNGEIWLSYKLSHGIFNSGNAAFPSALRNFLQGSFTLVNFNGDSMGTLTFGPHQAWGLRPFLRRGGAEVGDYLLLIFNLATKDVRAALGDENLPEEFLDSPTAPNSDDEAQGVLGLQDYQDESGQTQSFGEIEIREIFSETG